MEIEMGGAFVSIEPSCSWPNPYLYLEVVAQWRGVEFIVPPLPPVATPARQ
jgi:hypothetical protein